MDMAPKIDRRDFLKLLPLLTMGFVPCLNPQSRIRTQDSSDEQVPPNIIIVLFDALSARHLSLYGYERETTPNLARFAGQAIVYHSHYAAGNFTVPGVASLLTGTYPWTHRAFHHAGEVADKYEQRSLFALLGDTYNRVAYPHNIWAHFLVNQFRRHVDVYIGPETFSVFSDMPYTRLIPPGANIGFRSLQRLLFRDIGFPGSFLFSLINQLRTYLWKEVNLEAYKESYPKGLPSLGPTTDVLFELEDVIDGILAVTSDLQQPFFAYYHLFPPHDPYRPRREFVDLFDDQIVHTPKEPHFFSQGHSDEILRHKRREYDQYVAYVDAEFGRLYDSMAASGMLDSTYVIVTSDHGELFERGIWGHDTQVLYEPIIQIPLVISKPGQKQREDVYKATNCVDLVPTLLQIAGQGTPGWCEGRMLPSLGGEHDSQRSLFCVDAKSNSAWSPISIGTVALIGGRYKLIHYFGYPGYRNEYELYDLENDPEELENLYSSTNPIAANLQEQLELKLQKVNQPYV